MDLNEFLNRLNNGETVEGGSQMHQFMHKVSQEALRITAELNGTYHLPEEVRRLFSELTGKTVDESFGLFSAVLFGLRKKYYCGQKCIY